jgi:AAA+ ATPase superfamily predicted ATPase
LRIAFCELGLNGLPSQVMNPFSLSPYVGEEYFCDRIEETKRIVGAFKNKRPLTLISLRRLGKTGLIQHVHHQLPKRVLKIYLDINDTSSDEEFANKLILRCISELNRKKKNTVQRAIELFSQFRAGITIDPLTGTPSLSVELGSPSDVKHSIHTLFAMLAESGLSIQLAIDEFQRIAEYPETTIDATVREAMHANPDLHIIFSGSKKHLLVDLFSDASRPLFGSTEIMHLAKIDYPSYMAFVKKHFAEVDKTIDDNQVHHILEWTKMHTYYTQYFCNLLFQHTEVTVTDTLIEVVKNLIFKSNESTYYLFRNLLTGAQWDLLKAIASEDEMHQPTSSDIRNKYALGASSTVSRSLDALLDKEMIYNNITSDHSSYEVYDVFLSRWLQQYNS